jgi:hypothetical protein
MNAIEIHGYAIVSDDDRIADATGRMPEALRNDADWAYFQAGLDAASLSVLGRLGHEANPNRRNRPRLVVSSRAHGLEQRADAWWWNPARLAWQDVVRAVVPQGGQVAVPGGRRVFDLFLAIGYDAFHLSRVTGLRIPGGIAVFSACDDGQDAGAVLSGAGLRPGPSRILDQDGPVILSVWRPHGPGALAPGDGTRKDLRGPAARD